MKSKYDKNFYPKNYLYNSFIISYNKIDDISIFESISKMPKLSKVSVQGNTFLMKNDFKIENLKTLFKNNVSLITQMSNEKKNKIEEKKTSDETMIKIEKSGTSLNVSDFSNFWQTNTPSNHDNADIKRPQTSKNMNVQLKLGY